MNIAMVERRGPEQVDQKPEGEPVRAGPSRRMLRRRDERGGRRDGARKDEFLATATHELRNAVTAMNCALEIIARCGDVNAQSGAIRIARQQLDSMRCLLDDMTELGSGSGHRTTLNRGSVILQEVIADAVDACRPILEARQHRIDVDLPPQPIRLSADAQRVSQVLLNLLINAGKFTPRGGHVAVSASTDGAMAEIRVCDDGAGIEPEALERIFEPFRREERCKELAPHGLGIGLAVARRLIDLHGGSVRAASAGAGHGATFFVRLPL
jgi:signal transduction histidine kinase